jgi:hypothetical protein
MNVINARPNLDLPQKELSFQFVTPHECAQNQHVGIDRHTDRQNYAGDTGNVSVAPKRLDQPSSGSC